MPSTRTLAGPVRSSFVVVVLLLALAPAAGADGAPEGWKLEAVHLTNGGSLYGLIEEEGPTEVRLRVVSRTPTGFLMLSSMNLKRPEVKSVERLETADHEALVERVKSLTAEKQTESALLGAIDPTRKNRPGAEKLDLQPDSTFGKKDGYICKSDHFELVSNARKELIVGTAEQLELIHAAFVRQMPPRVKSARQTTIFLPKSLADYQALLKQQGRTFINTAYYDAARNQIVCPADLQRLSDEWGNAYARHEELRKRLDDQEAEYNKLYKNKLPADLKNRIAADRKKIDATNAQNKKDCEALLQKLLQPLYHEAFHAYLNNFVYPPSEAPVPRWLNEGLAQVFEAAKLEGGELRVEAPDPDRLAWAQRKNELVGLADLLRSGPKQFLAAHNSELQTSDRYYVTSWALAHYLTFERNQLGPKALDDYVASLKRGTDPVTAFSDLVGQPLPQFEKEFRQFYTRHGKPK